MNNNLWIIAQAGDGGSPQVLNAEDMTSENVTQTLQDGSNGDTTEEKPAEKTKDIGPLQWLLPAVMIIMVVMMFRAPQKQKKERKQLEQSLEKNDRILTIGGIYGTIVDIKDDEVTLKIDESNNTKIKVTRSAIGRNVSKD